MLRNLLFFGILCCLPLEAAEAKTIRYEFNVVDSAIGYQRLEASHTIGAAEYDAFTAAYHSLGGALGLSGPIILEVVENNKKSWETDLLCVSGFLCESNAFQGSKVGNYSDLSGFNAYPPGYEWNLTTSSSGSGELSFFDDHAIGGGGFLGDVLYVWWGPQATFTLASLNISVVSAAPTPVPLPAAAWLLGLGLLILGRKTKQAQKIFKA